MYKNLRTKQMMGLALVLFLAVPMLLAAMPAASAFTQTGSPATLSVVPHNSLGAVAGTVTDIAAQAVNTNVVVDVRVDNYATLNSGDPAASNGISGISYMITWDPTVLQYVSKADGNYLPSQSNAGDLTNKVAQGQVTIGQTAFDQGNAYAVASDPAGSVTATITFKVLTTGTSALAIQPSAAGVAYVNAPSLVAGVVSGHGLTGTLTANAQYNHMYTTVSLYQSGTSNNQITVSGNPIGQTFSVDMYVSNPLAVNIWAWNLGVTWNPAAVDLTAIHEGSYLSAGPLDNGQGATTLFVPGYVNHNAGTIPQGISDAYLAYTTTHAASGVLCTLTFQVVGWADSNINLVTGIPSLETLNGQTPAAVSPAPLLNNAHYTSQAAPQTASPVAKISNMGTTPRTVYTNGYTIPSTFSSGIGVFSLSAIDSTPGSDIIPNPGQYIIPVTGYTWTIPSGITLTSGTTSTRDITFNVPTVTATTTFTISLSVAAPNTGDTTHTYTPTSTTVTLTFMVQPPVGNSGALIDVYISNVALGTNTTTQPFYSPNGYNGNPLNNGNGVQSGPNAFLPNSPCDAFGPQQQMNLAAIVTYNAAPVANKEVTFQIVDNHGNTIATYTALTGDNGIATVNARLPWYDGAYQSGPQSEFGTWTVYASTLVQQTNAYDNMPFQFGDLISIKTVSLNQYFVPRSTTTTPSSDAVTVQMSGISGSARTYYITYTVVDAGNVPIATGMIQGTMPAATYTGQGNAFTVTSATSNNNVQTFTVPTWAFCGGAQIYVNVYNANPVNGIVQNTGAVAYCPQATLLSSQTFTIGIPNSEMPTTPA